MVKIKQILQQLEKIIQPISEIISSFRQIIYKQKVNFYVFGLGILIGIGSLVLLDQFHIVELSSKQYAYVDVEKVINSVNQSITVQTEEKHLSETQINDKINIAKTEFNILLKNYAAKHNAIIFSANKVIAGSDNVTDYFTTKILEVIK